jgi:uncharacterized protein
MGSPGESSSLDKITLHIEKKGIRALGIAESFSSRDQYSTLCGVVMRSDLIIDGVAFGRLVVSGFDATRSVEQLFEGLARNDVNAIMISGSVLSLYNIIDIDELFRATEIPILAISFKKSRSDLAKNIRARFDQKTADAKIRMLERLGSSHQLTLNTGYKVFLRIAGITTVEAKRVVDKFTLQGAIPEPVRVARLFAKSVASSSLARKNT